jgi:predicted GNAT family acetyltransferase
VIVRCFDDAAAALAAAQPLLSADPVGCTVPAVVLHDVAAGVLQYPDALFLVLGDPPVGLLLHTPPHPPYLTPMPTAVAEAAVDALAARRDSLPGINGARAAATAAAQRWCALRPGVRAHERTAVRLHRLTSLVVPVGVPGQVRHATSDDLPLLTSWWAAFATDVHGVRGQDLARRAAGRLRSGRTLLWEVDGMQVAMASRTTPAFGVSRIGPVYTPPSQRTRGYGGAVTAAAAQDAREAGATQVVLFTDLANPTSNRLYARLGFVPAGEFVQLRFAAVAQ